MSDIDQILKELLDDLVPTIEAADSKNTVLLQLLKDKGIVSEEELAPYLEQAANASSVKERAARLRFEHLFEAAIKSLQQSAQETATKAVEQKKEEEKQGESSAPTRPRKKEKTEKKQQQEHRDASEPQSPQTTASQNPTDDNREHEKPVPKKASEPNAA